MKRVGEPMKDNFSIENLIKIGLIESEAKIYLNLLKKKSFTASEISRLSGISRSKTYEILNQLVGKGLCVEILGSVKKYASANPKTAFNGLQQKLQQEYENKKILISNLSEILLPLYLSEKENTDPLDYIQVIREKNSIIKKFESLEQMSTQEVLSLVKGPAVMDVTKPYNPEQYSSLKRGVNFKTIYAIELLKNKYLLESIVGFVNAGEEVRIENKLPIPFKMYVFDKKTVMFTLEDRITSKPSLTAMIIEHLDLAKGLKQVFNLYWQNSMTLEEFKNKGV